MLSLFRKGGVAQLVMGAVVFAIIVVFVLEFRAGRGPSASLSQDCAISVYDSCLDAKDFYAAYGLIVPPGMSSKQITRLELRKNIANGLIERELLIHEASRLGVSIGEGEIDDELANGRAHLSLPTEASFLAYSLGLCLRNPVLQRCEPGTGLLRLLPVKSAATKELDYKIYERVVRNTTNRSPKEFKEMQRRELIAERMRDLVRSRARISDAEAFDQFARERSKAVVRIVKLDRDWFAKYTVDAGDAAVDKWAAENKEQVDSAWKAEEKNYTAGCSMLREILVPFDEGASDDDKKTAREKIDAAAAALKKGGSFETEARHLDSGPTAMVGGELGCIGESYGTGAKELLDAAAKLKLGEASPVLETQRGFHLIRVEKRLAETELASAGRRTVARRLYARFIADERMNKFATDLIARVKSGEKLDDATQALAAAYLPLAPKAGAARTLGKKPEEVPAALSDDSRPKVEISAPFTLDGSPIPDVLASELPAVHAFDLAKPEAIYDKPLKTRSGLAVMQLKELDPAKREEFEKDRARFTRLMRAAKQDDALGRFMERIRAAAKDKIKVDARYLEESKDRKDD